MLLGALPGRLHLPMEAVSLPSLFRQGCPRPRPGGGARTPVKHVGSAGGRRGDIMPDYMTLVLLVGVWIVAVQVILPWLGFEG